MLHIFWFFERLAVDIYDVVCDLQAVSGQAYGPLHEILPAVHRTHHHGTEHIGIFRYVTTSVFHTAAVFQSMHYMVIVGFGTEHRHRVAARRVEHYYVVALHIAQAGQTVVVKLYGVYITLRIDHWKRVLRQREVQRCLWHSRSVDSLVYPQIVAYEQGFFER